MSDPLVGHWELVRFTLDPGDGRPAVHPFGAAPRGRIHYDASGWMSAILSRTDRDALAVSRLESAFKASDREKAAAFDGYLSYAGRWHRDGDEVVHTVELALVPNIVGLEQRRWVELDGDHLVLSYRIGSRRYRLQWERVGGSGRAAGGVRG